MPLGKHQVTVQDSAGNIVNGASIEVRTEAGNVLASLFSDTDGVTPLGNPFTAADGADAGFFVADGTYKIVATSGALTKTWRYVTVVTVATQPEIASKLHLMNWALFA